MYTINNSFRHIMFTANREPKTFNYGFLIISIDILFRRLS